MRKEAKDKEKRVGIALAGNPNVGKSTLFNALTGMNQHTGNWAGKTVECARGVFKKDGKSYEITDIPGTFSIYPRSREEEVAAEYICYGECKSAVIIIDSARPERSLKLALEIIDVMPEALLCFNLLDEAEKMGVECNARGIGEELSLDVVSVIAKRKRTLAPLKEKIATLTDSVAKETKRIAYPRPIEDSIEKISSLLSEKSGITERRMLRHTALSLLHSSDLCERARVLFRSALDDDAFKKELESIRQELFTIYENQDGVSETISGSLVKECERICEKNVIKNSTRPTLSLFDRLLTGKLFAYPCMMLLLLLVLYLTISLANYPSMWLESLFTYIGEGFKALLIRVNVPPLLFGALYDGIYTVLTRVISVMLPPMAIFFPLFTLLEDTGFLPRFAYNLDRPLCCAGACGKQALSMCMCLGCTASGIIGCRIIDSPRERKIAIVTSSLMPCNGKFPTMIILAATFFTFGSGSLVGLSSAIFLCGIILLSVAITLICSKILSKTVYKGSPSFFTIEMPPPRKPDLVKVLVRSLLDRTLSVLVRAIAVAAPAGLLIWTLTVIKAGDVSLLSRITELLDPIGIILGLDGVILTAFLLGFPANEIVLPIAVIGYCQSGIAEAMSAPFGEILLGAGWTVPTAICCAVFSLFHFPCSTSVLTAYKETKSLKTTALCILLPCAVGTVLCAALSLIFSIVGI